MGHSSTHGQIWSFPTGFKGSRQRTLYCPCLLLPLGLQEIFLLSASFSVTPREIRESADTPSHQPTSAGNVRGTSHVSPAPGEAEGSPRMEATGGARARGSHMGRRP